MTRSFPNISLSIREKVTVGFTLAMIAVLVVSIVGYRNLVRIERKMRFVESAEKIHYDLLEVRRYEKNFLLYCRKNTLRKRIKHSKTGKTNNGPFPNE